MINLAEKDSCTGCMSCVKSCAKNAINIVCDATGNAYPEIVSELCIQCHKCENSCPELHLLAFNRPDECYAVWSLNDVTRKASASGGAAAEFYSYALEQGWWICGAEYNNDCTVSHTVSRNKEQIIKYQQSKYVYSDISNVYSNIKSLLVNGDKVICISLPCKIAGLLKYLGKTYDNLLTVDIVCHGTPTQKDLVDHIHNVGGKATSLNLKFREDNIFLFDLSIGTKKVYRKIGRTDTYLAAFLEGLNYRASCYKCNYAKPERITDITICDFWGLGQETPFEHPYTGSISAVLLNTDKGKSFFEGCEHKFFTEKRSVDEAIKGNAQLSYPTPIHNKRQEYMDLYRAIGFEQAVKKCLKSEMSTESKKILKNNITNTVRKSVKKVLGLAIPKYRS